MRIVGVDPGLGGAFALLHDDELDIADMPTIGGEINAWAVGDLLVGWSAVDLVVLELAASRPGQSAPAMFRFGVGYGILQGVCATLQRPVTFATPTVWTKHHRVGSDKNVHRRRACELWPEQAHLFARKKDDGRADAALIARWAADAQQRKRGVA